MKTKLTKWFEDSAKPARRGVYQVRFQNDRKELGYAYFDGRRWAWFWWSIKDADSHRHTKNADQDKEWRGLAANPKKKGGAA